MRTHGNHRKHRKIDWDEVRYTIRCDWQEYLRAAGIIGAGIALLFVVMLLTALVQKGTLSPDDVRNWLSHLWRGD